MFTECPSILGRYKLAKEAGFAVVESGFPLGCSIEQVVEAKTSANVNQILINVFTGKMSIDCFSQQYKEKLPYN